MRANDFLTDAETGTKFARKVNSVLKQLGYKKIASGADSTVWTKDTGRVIKIIMPETPGQGAVKTFKRFIDFSRQHSDVPNLPKFYDLESNLIDQLNLDGNDYMAIAMEKLMPIKRDTFPEAMIWVLSDFAAKNLSWSEVEKQINNEQTWKYWEGKNKAASIIAAYKNLSPTQNQEYQLLYTLMKLLYRAGSMNKLGWDLHTENVMQRGDGTLVVIDPWFTVEENL